MAEGLTMPPMGSIGRLLEEERLRRGDSQDEAAASLKVSQATFSRWVAGTAPKSEHWSAIARFLKVPRAEVVKLLTDERLADPVEVRMAGLEDRVERIESKVDRLLEALDQSAPRSRRGAR